MKTLNKNFLFQLIAGIILITTLIFVPNAKAVEGVNGTTIQIKNQCVQECYREGDSVWQAACFNFCCTGECEQSFMTEPSTYPDLYAECRNTCRPRGPYDRVSHGHFDCSWDEGAEYPCDDWYSFWDDLYEDVAAEDGESGSYWENRWIKALCTFEAGLTPGNIDTTRLGECCGIQCSQHAPGNSECIDYCNGNLDNNNNEDDVIIEEEEEEEEQSSSGSSGGDGNGSSGGIPCESNRDCPAMMACSSAGFCQSQQTGSGGDTSTSSASGSSTSSSGGDHYTCEQKCHMDSNTNIGSCVQKCTLGSSSGSSGATGALGPCDTLPLEPQAKVIWKHEGGTSTVGNQFEYPEPPAPDEPEQE